MVSLRKSSTRPSNPEWRSRSKAHRAGTSGAGRSGLQAKRPRAVTHRDRVRDPCDLSKGARHRKTLTRICHAQTFVHTFHRPPLQLDTCRSVTSHRIQQRFAVALAIRRNINAALYLVQESFTAWSAACTALVVRKKNSNPAGSEPTDRYLKKLLGSVGSGKTFMQCEAGRKVFSQGEKANAIYFVQSGKVKVSVVSAAGKEAVLSIITPRHFFGEGCLVGQTVRRNGWHHSTACHTIYEQVSKDRLDRLQRRPHGPAGSAE